MTQAKVRAWRMISFTVLAESPVEEALRMACWTQPATPLSFIPSSEDPGAWHGMIRDESWLIGVSSCYFFTLEDGGLKLQVNLFFLPGQMKCFKAKRMLTIWSNVSLTPSKVLSMRMTGPLWSTKHTQEYPSLLRHDWREMVLPVHIHSPT